MAHLRLILTDRPWLTLAIVLAALAVRITVPAGMMPGAGAGGPTLIVCPGHHPAAAMPGMPMPERSHGHDGVPSDVPCSYTALLAAALDTAVVPVAASAVAFVTLATAVLIAPVVSARRLWPPRRGPPGCRSSLTARSRHPRRRP